MAESGHLKILLDSLYGEFNTSYLDRDPLEFVKQYDSPDDQEVVGFIASALAIGRVELFRKAVQSILDIMGPSPRKYVEAFDPVRNRSDFTGFVYRFYREQDILLLMWWTHQMIQSAGSLEAFFMRDYEKDAPHIGPAMSRFVRSIFSLPVKPVMDTLPSKGSGIRHFLADPEDGSACKRLNLYLRWMVRQDHLDAGIWKDISPSQLIIPLDTHIARLGKALGLTSRQSPGWAMAVEITEALKEYDSNDPVKYDFALCTVGKLNQCPKHPGQNSCGECPIKGVCLNMGAEDIDKK